MANKIMKVAQDVIAGDYGSGEKRVNELKKKGYDPVKVQDEVNRQLSCRELIIQNMRAWAIKVSAEDYHYVYWTEPYGHECAKCHPHGGKNEGWQCIGWAIACWHHGGLPIPCNCGVLDNGTCEKIYKAKSDAEALKIARKALKTNDIKVIRNSGKTIPKDWVQAGDIGSLFTGSTFQHLVMFMGGGKLTDSTHGKTKANDIRADRNFTGSYVSRLKFLIRYTGNGLTKPAKKSIDALAHEVIDGLWYSGDVRKRALIECGYDYNAVQKRVTEILTPSKKGYQGKFPTYRLTKSNAEVKADACTWAKRIADNNDFHYGMGKAAHHNGCYYCGTQPKAKRVLKMWETTYCCNPFIGAAWAHGGGDATAYRMCHKGTSWDFGTGAGSYHTSKLFDNLGKPAQKNLKPGDVLCGDTHVALYIGDRKVVQAGHQDDNKINSSKWNSSISVGSWGGWKRAYRYNGKVDCDRVILKGEYSTRVADMQRFLVWYGYKIKVTGFYNSETLKAVIDFQEKEIGKGQGDGSVGPKTIEAMKKVKK